MTPFDGDHVTIGASVVFLQSYRRRDVCPGIDRFSDGVGARLFANIRAGGFVTTIGAVKGVSGGTGGTVADVSLSYSVRIFSRFSLTPTAGGTWADRRHNDRYFGVTAAESAATGLAPFTAGAGIKDVPGGLTASYRFTERIIMIATGTVTTLLDAVDDSDQVDRRTRPSGFLTVAYRW